MASSSSQLSDIISIEIDSDKFRQWLVSNGYDENLIHDLDKVDFRNLLAREIQRKVNELKSLNLAKRASSPGRTLSPTRTASRATSPTRRYLPDTNIDKDGISVPDNELIQYYGDLLHGLNKRLFNPVENSKNPFKSYHHLVYDQYIEKLVSYRQLSRSALDILSQILQLYVNQYLQLKASGVILVSQFLMDRELDEEYSTILKTLEDEGVALGLVDDAGYPGEYVEERIYPKIAEVELEHGLFEANSEVVAQMILNDMLKVYPDKVDKIAQVVLTEPKSDYHNVYMPWELVMLRNYGSKYMTPENAVMFLNRALNDDSKAMADVMEGYKSDQYQQNQRYLHPREYYAELLKYIPRSYSSQINSELMQDLGMLIFVGKDTMTLK